MSIFKSALNKLKQGLARTRSGSAGTVRTILTGKRLSPELLKELEILAGPDRYHNISRQGKKRRRREGIFIGKGGGLACFCV